MIQLENLQIVHYYDLSSNALSIYSMRTFFISIRKLLIISLITVLTTILFCRLG